VVDGLFFGREEDEWQERVEVELQYLSYGCSRKSKIIMTTQAQGPGNKKK
jgi:hypothetical protein